MSLTMPSAVLVPCWRSPLARLQYGVRRCVSSSVLLASVLAGSTLGQLGCSGDTLNGPPPVDAAHLYWRLQIAQPHAINLAMTPPYDTVRLSAVARNVLGAPLPGIGTVTWVAALDSSVRVDATGLVTARQPVGLTYVIASLLDVQQHLTLADTVWIQVHQTATPIRMFSVQPAPGDSAIRSIGQFGSQFTWYATAVDSAGTAPSDSVCTVADTANTSCPNLLIAYSTSDTKLINPIVTAGGARLAPVFNLGAKAGAAYVTATTLAYGQVLRDSILMTVKAANKYLIQLAMGTTNGTVVTAVGFDAPKILTLGAGAVVEWTSFGSANTTPFDITFDQAGVAAADTASCTVVNTQAQLLPTYGSIFGFPYPSVFAPSGRGNIAPFGADTTGDGTQLMNGNIPPFIQFVSVPTSIDNTVSPPDTTFSPFSDTTWFVNDCRARRFHTPGTYHWTSRLAPNETYTLTIVP